MTEPVAGAGVPPLHIAALVKQIPAFESMQLGADGRLVREGLPLEMSAYCRRAVAQAVLLVSAHGGSVVVVTMGPPSALDVLREAVAYGRGLGVEIAGVLVSDPQLVGSDTLATARALGAAVRSIERDSGCFDLILSGRSSVDADTGQVGPQLATILDLPFAAGVKRLALRESGRDEDPGGSGVVADVGCEHDDLWVEATVALPAILSTAERLIDPCKIKDPDAWVAGDDPAIRRLRATDLGDGPWGAAASPTSVGEVRTEHVEREGQIPTGTLTDQVAEVVGYLDDHGLLARGDLHDRVDEGAPVAAPPANDQTGAGVVVVVEPGRDRLSAELLGAAARMAQDLGTDVWGFGPPPIDGREMALRGARGAVEVTGAESPEDLADALAGWLSEIQPWIVLAGSTIWGREVASRAAAATSSGLTGDAVGLVVDRGRLLAWKPAFGGQLLAAVRASSRMQMATVRPGMLPLHRSLVGSAVPDVVVESLAVEPRRRVVVLSQERVDDLDTLASAEMVIGVGRGVDPSHYPRLEGLRRLLGAELAATRKVTDAGWLPHARQLGITGRSISPRLYVAIGMSGRLNHMVGVRSAGTILAINPDREAPLFAFADLGLIAPWEAAIPELERQILERLS